MAWYFPLLHERGLQKKGDFYCYLHSRQVIDDKIFRYELLFFGRSWTDSPNNATHIEENKIRLMKLGHCFFSSYFSYKHEFDEESFTDGVNLFLLQAHGKYFVILFTFSFSVYLHV